MEHILVAEKMLGRPMESGEVVHHIDHNRSNNTMSNLMVFASQKDHAAFHKGAKSYAKDGIWYTEENICVCEFCKKTYIPSESDQKYCSVACARLSQIKTLTDLNNIQSMLIQNNGNFSKVARLFNVSSSGIAKRLKYHGLPSRSKDYKRNS